MVRPRLVEEGAPIAAQHEGGQSLYVSGASQQQLYHRRQDDTAPSINAASSSLPSSSSSSSLMQATAGRRLPTVAPRDTTSERRQNMSIVIGQENTMEIDDAFDEPQSLHHVDDDINSYHHRHRHELPQRVSHYEIPRQDASTTSIHNQHNHYHPRDTPAIPSSRACSNRGNSASTDDSVQRMQGVEDHSIKPPLVVVDGANVAYAYARVLLQGTYGSDDNIHQKLEPDVRGICVAGDYFVQAGIRVIVVLPESFYRRRRNKNKQEKFHCIVGRKNSDSDAAASQELDAQWMAQDQQAALDYIHDQGWLVGAPPADDDDAYVLTIAQRENMLRQRLNAQNNSKPQPHAPAFCLSNDWYRDAQARDPTDQLGQWLRGDADTNNDSPQSTTGAGRISYCFGDLGRLDDYGQRALDFLPNPRHPLVVWATANIAAQNQHQ